MDAAPDFEALRARRNAAAQEMHQRQKRGRWWRRLLVLHNVAANRAAEGGSG